MNKQNKEKTYINPFGFIEKFRTKKIKGIDYVYYENKNNIEKFQGQKCIINEEDFGLGYYYTKNINGKYDIKYKDHFIIKDINSINDLINIFYKGGKYYNIRKNDKNGISLYKNNILLNENLYGIEINPNKDIYIHNIDLEENPIIGIGSPKLLFMNDDDNYIYKNKIINEKLIGRKINYFFNNKNSLISVVNNKGYEVSGKIINKTFIGYNNSNIEKEINLKFINNKIIILTKNKNNNHLTFYEIDEKDNKKPLIKHIKNEELSNLGGLKCESLFCDQNGNTYTLITGIIGEGFASSGKKLSIVFKNNLIESLHLDKNVSLKKYKNDIILYDQDTLGIIKTISLDNKKIKIKNKLSI